MFTLQLTVQLLGSRKQGEKQGESTLAAAQSLPSGRQEERRAAHHLADHTAHQLQSWEPTAWLKYAPQTPLSRVVSEYIQVVDRNVVNGQLSSSLSRSIPMLIVVIQQLCFTPTSACCRFVKEPSAGPGWQISVSILPILQILKMRQRVEITCLKSTEWIGNWTRCRNYTLLILCFQWLASTSFHLIYC